MSAPPLMTPLTPEQQAFVERYWGFSRRFAFKKRRLLMQNEDLIIDAALDGLIRVARSHSLQVDDKNVKNLIATAIRLMMITYYQKYINSHKGEFQLRSLGGFYLDSFEHGGSQSAIRNFIQKDEIDQMLSLVPPEFAETIRLRFGLDGGPQLQWDEVADRQGITTVGAQYRVKKAFKLITDSRA